MGLVLLASLVLAALRYPTVLSSSACYTLVVLMVGIATALAVVLRGRRRAFWVGFAAVGLLSTGLSFRHFSDATSEMPALLPFPILEGMADVAPGPPKGSALSWSEVWTRLLAPASYDHMLWTSICLSILLVSLLGAIVTKALTPRDEPPEASRHS
jgi:hypothetical protein